LRRCYLITLRRYFGFRGSVLNEGPVGSTIDAGMTLANSASRRSAIVSAGSVSTGTPTRYRTATEERRSCGTSNVTIAEVLASGLEGSPTESSASISFRPVPPRLQPRLGEFDGSWWIRNGSQPFSACSFAVAPECPIQSSGSRPRRRRPPQILLLPTPMAIAPIAEPGRNGFLR